MDRDKVKLVVRTTLAVMQRIAQRTRTQADDLMAAILKSNEERIVDAVVALQSNSEQQPTDAQVVAALEKVGIKV